MSEVQTVASNQAGAAHSSSVDELLQIVTFQVGNETFGLDILKVHEIIRFQPLTRVPNLPEYVEGVLNLRGKIIPVVSLRQRMGLESREKDVSTKIVVANVKSEVWGLVVDSVSEVLRISNATVDPTPRVGEAAHKYVSGVGKLNDRILLLLDVDELLSDEGHSSCQ
jgi:purine-binding chemotaxis protein CheW